MSYNRRVKNIEYKVLKELLKIELDIFAKIKKSRIFEDKYH